MDNDQEEKTQDTLTKRQEAERLRAFIDNNTNLSDKELANLLGISPKQLCKYTNSGGKTINSAPRDVLLKLREVFGLDLNWLITGKSADIDYVSIPLYEWGISEQGYQTTLTKTKLISIPAITLKDFRPEKLQAVFIEGNELSTSEIDIGDLVIFHPFDVNSKREDGTYIIRYNNFQGMNGTKTKINACTLEFNYDKTISLRWTKDKKEIRWQDDSENIIGKVVACIHTYRPKKN